MAQKLANFVIALMVATCVAGHGHVNNIVINELYYDGYDPTKFPYEADPPIVVGWAAGDTDNRFVAPDAYQTPGIICHKNAVNARGHTSVMAGASVLLQWVPAPWQHPGPVLTYLANCNGECETVDKTTLEFFKIGGIGLISGGNPGNWASDVLIANNNTWVVQIPEDLETGNYVLRHEIIALHSAEEADGAQNYPQCFNLAITGTGSLRPTGIIGTEVYYAWPYLGIRPSFKCRSGELRRDSHQQRHSSRRCRYWRDKQRSYNGAKIDVTGHNQAQIFFCYHYVGTCWHRNPEFVRPVRWQWLLWPDKLCLAGCLYYLEPLLCPVP